MLRLVINVQRKSPNSFIQQILIEHLHYAIKIIFLKAYFLQILHNTSLEFQSLHILEKRSLKLFFYSSNKSIPSAKVVYFLSLGFSSSTSILLSRIYLPHCIYLCQALPSLNLTLSSTKEIFQKNPNQKEFSLSNTLS